MYARDGFWGGHRGPLALAVGVWTIFLLSQIAFNFAVGLSGPRSHVHALAWALHGLALTLPLHLLLVRLGGAPAVVRWLVVAAAILVLTWLQGWFDAIVARNLGLLMRELFPTPGPRRSVSIMLMRGESLREIGTPISLMIYLWVFTCYAVALNLLVSQRRLFDSRRRAQTAEIEALRLQLNPHFLFNALNSVSSLIVTGRHREAEAATLNLADFLHGALADSGGGLVPLEDELNTVEAYLQVEAVRFGERLQVDIDVPDELQRLLVPSFALQPLVENAVKYAVAPAARPVTIVITAEADGPCARVTIADDGDPARAAAVPSGTRIGLSTTRDRLRALYGADARLEATPGPHGFTVVLTVPRRLADNTTGPRVLATA